MGAAGEFCKPCSTGLLRGVAEEEDLGVTEETLCTDEEILADDFFLAEELERPTTTEDNFAEEELIGTVWLLDCSNCELWGSPTCVLLLRGTSEGYIT